MKAIMIALMLALSASAAFADPTPIIIDKPMPHPP